MIVFLINVVSPVVYSFSDSPNIIEKNQNNILVSLFDADIIIPDDYPTIQEGIDQADPYSNIFVRSGVYKENIVIG